MLGNLRKNLFILYGAELLGKVLGLVVFGYLGRTLLQARYGDLEFALGLLFLMNLVIDAGLAHYGAREAAKAPENTNALVGQIAMVRAALVVLSLLVLGGIAALMPRDSLAKSLIVLQALVLLPAPLILTWVFQARDQMHVVAAASVIRQVFLAAGVLLFVRSPPDVWQVPVWDAVGLGVAVVLQVVLFRRSGGVINPLGFLGGIRRVVVESAPLAGSSVVWALRLFFPLLALGIFTTSAETGIFGAGHRLVIAVHTFVWLYFFNILPSFSRLAVREDLSAFGHLFTTSMRLVGWVALCGASIGCVLAPVLIPLVYGQAMAAASAPFAVMVWMLTFSFISGHHRFGLIALSLQRTEFWASAAGATVSLLGCLALGTGLTPTSAAWIFVTAEATTLVCASLLLRRAVPGLAVFSGLGRPLAAASAAMLGVMPMAPENPIVAAVALLGIYALVVAAFERDGLRELVNLRRAVRRT